MSGCVDQKNGAQENWVLNVCWQNVKPASLNYRTGERHVLFSRALSLHVNKQISSNSLLIIALKDVCAQYIMVPLCWAKQSCTAVKNVDAVQNGRPFKQNPPFSFKYFAVCPWGPEWRKWTEYTGRCQSDTLLSNKFKVVWAISRTESKSVAWMWK